MGAIGYFPTYALGNLYGAQFFAAMENDLAGMDESIARGDFSAITRWLRENIHSSGASRTAGEICLSATGKPLNADYFMQYLRKKYGEIYKL